MDLREKVAIVTGSSRGVGRATALALSKQGAAVVVNYNRSRDAAEDVVKEIHACGGRAAAHQADVSEDAACRGLVEVAHCEFGGLDVLVNNAGTTRFIAHSDLDAVTDEVWDEIFGVNVKGPFQCIRAALSSLQESGDAEIVNVASIAGFSTAGSSVPYGASKAALINMTVNLARALGPNIRVNAVAPGFIDGDWLHQGLGEDFDSAKQAVEGKSALGKVCRPEDVAAAIMSLLTGSDLVTGQTLVVDGGNTIGAKAT